MSESPRAQPPRRKVLLIDDHPLVRLGLSNIINQEADLEVCGESDGDITALAVAQQLQPDIAVVDWSLKDQDAAELISSLRRHLPRMPLLVLSMHEELFYAERALRAGAHGYIMKREAAEKVAGAIRGVLAGRVFLSDRMAHLASSLARDPLPPASRPGPAPQAAPGAAHAGTPPPPRLSVVIPVYNAEATIERLCEQLVAELRPTYRLQVILVDDDSQDRSAQACQRLCERYPEELECVTLARNFGEHNAVMAGLNCADGDYCVIMDDDFQNPPAEVHKLVAAARQGFDVVYVRYEAKQHPRLRNLGSRLHNWMATRALGKPADLYLSSFKVVSRFLVQEIVRYTGPDPYIDAIVLRSTRRIGVVTSRHAPRQHGKSGYTFGKLIALWGNMTVAFSLYPLRLMGALGVLMLLVGVGFSLYTLASWVLPGLEDPDRLQRLNATNWLFRGLTLLAVGLVGEYVGRIYLHFTREPQFIIRHITRRRL